MVKLSDKLRDKEEARLRQDVSALKSVGISKQSISKYLDYVATTLYGLKDISADDVGITGYSKK
jgi:hypothetical protein